MREQQEAERHVDDSSADSQFAGPRVRRSGIRHKRQQNRLGHRHCGSVQQIQKRPQEPSFTTGDRPKQASA
jgi:hypothetical protein